jgi:hypothetical protein
MVDNILRIMKSAVFLLSSRVFLLWMMGGWITYYVLSSIWMEEAFGSFAVGIRDNLFIRIPFIVFLASGYFNLVRASFMMFTKNKMFFLTRVILPLGVLVFFTGFFLSLSLRESGQRMVGEGDIIKPPWVMSTYHVTAITPGLKDRLSNTGTDRSIFIREPVITLTDRNTQSYNVGTFPPVKIDDTYYHILNFGIAPGVKLFQGDKLRFGGYQPLGILSPGKSDSFSISSYPYRFLVSMEPEQSFREGEGFVSEFNIEKPLYRTTVFMNNKVIAEGDSKEGVRFGNFRLYFTDHTFWVMLEAAKDPGLPVLKLGILLILTGIPLFLISFFFQEKAGRQML